MRAAAGFGGLALVLVLALAGCEVLQSFTLQEPAPIVQAESVQPAGTESLLLYFEHLRRMPIANLEREHDAVQLAYTRNASDLNRVRLAMVLSVPNTKISDSARALELLDPPRKDPRAALHGLAMLIGTYLEDQRRLTANAQVTQQRLDEAMNAHQQERRRHESNIQEMQRKYESNIQELQRKHESSVQEMQKKLEQLKSLERALIQREREGPVRR